MPLHMREDLPHLPCDTDDDVTIFEKPSGQDAPEIIDLKMYSSIGSTVSNQNCEVVDQENKVLNIYQSN
jgi:hypothetical protein